MVAIKKRVAGKQTYYYIEHSFRKNGRVQKKEKYIGKKLPENAEQLKRKFLSEIYREKWFEQFDLIKNNFSQEQRKITRTTREKAAEAFMIRFTYDTSRIEGSKLTLRETANLLGRGITPDGKPLREAKEAEAHKKVFYAMLEHKKELSRLTILNWHRSLFAETKPDIAGKIRQHQVAISGSKFEPPLAVEIYPLIKEFFKWYERSRNKLHPVELAAMVHLKFVTIHPFTDGNGRMSRLMMNFVLQKHGYPMMNITYEKRNSYYNALERSQIKKEESIFLNWFFRRYQKEHRRYAK